MANNFANDSRIVSVYNFEPGALGADSKGTNNLAAVNGPVSETTIKKQGGGSSNLLVQTANYLHHC